MFGVGNKDDAKASEEPPAAAAAVAAVPEEPTPEVSVPLDALKQAEEASKKIPAVETDTTANNDSTPNEGPTENTKEEEAMEVEVKEEPPTPPELTVGTVVYKSFYPEWYFGYISRIDPLEGLYGVCYEDGDREDLYEDEVREIAVQLDSTVNEFAQTAKVPESDENVFYNPKIGDLKDLEYSQTGTADIVKHASDMFGTLDRALLEKFIEGQRQKLKEKEHEPVYLDGLVDEPRPFPAYPLGTIVYKMFDNGWFFGHVQRIDLKLKLYGVRYQDGDKEDLEERELEDILVLYETAEVALTTKIPEQVPLDEWEKVEENTVEVVNPGTVAVTGDPLYAHLDPLFLMNYIKKRHIHSRKRKKVPAFEMLVNKKKVPKPKPKPKPTKKRRVRPTNLLIPVKKFKKIKVDWKSPTKAKNATFRAIEDDDGKLHPMVLDFFQFIHQRHSLWLKRKKGASVEEAAADMDDLYRPLYSTFFFCNIYRELDRGTAYFHSKILDMHSAKETWEDEEWLSKVLWASYVYRQVNRVETFEAVGGIPTIEGVDDFGKNASARTGKEKVFTGAHQTTNFTALMGNLRFYAPSVRGRGGLKNFESIVKSLQLSTSVKSCLKILSNMKGIGKFLSWQILCDLRESNCLKSLESDTFCQLGPGALKGLDIMLGDSRVKGYLQETENLVACQDKAFEQLGLYFPPWQGQKLTTKEIEHALCEYSKFDSIKHKNSGRIYRCPVADLEPKSLVRFCDTCYAKDSDATPPGEVSSWLCGRCLTFRGKPFVEQETPPPEPEPVEEAEAPESNKVDQPMDTEPTKVVDNAEETPKTDADADAEPMQEEPSKPEEKVVENGDNNKSAESEGAPTKVAAV